MARQKVGRAGHFPSTMCHDMWDVVQQGFYVETPCHSMARPGKIMAGTRITLLQKAPDGFDFTIRTPGTPPRWVEMDQVARC